MTELVVEDKEDGTQDISVVTAKNETLTGDGSVESEPNGLSPHEAGAKLDAGKVRAALCVGGFSRALLAVGRVTTFGAEKYTPNGWRSVVGGIDRYDDAAMRHRLARGTGEERDPDSGLLHLAHEAWNALAILELYLEQENLK